MKPDITIYAAAVRPKYWMDFYNSIGSNDTSFEVIFVGPNEPAFKLPDNFKYIKSNTKPTQCFEIGRRNAVGELLLNVSDDCEFQTEHPLDVLYKTYKSYNDEKVIVSCRYMQNGVDRSETDHYFFCGDPTSPMMPMHSLISRKLLDRLGGIDRNFVAVFWDLDIAMRVYAIGGTVLFSDVYSNEDKSKKLNSDLCAKFGGPDRAFLEYLWTVRGRITYIRNIPVTPFSNYKLLEETQGQKGKW